MKPWGGIEQLAWSPDSKQVAYTCRKKTGLDYAVSTNSDIYIYNLATKQARNITEDNKGYDTNPQYSPDGRYIAWQSMERDGYEADLNRLFIMDLQTGEKRFLSEKFPSNVDSFLWDAASQNIYFLGVWHGEEHIYRLSLYEGDGQPLQITDGVCDYASLALCGDNLIATRHSMSEADEIFVVAASTAAKGQAATTRQLTFENKHIFDQLEAGRVEARWMTTTDGKQMLTWVIYPPHFNPKKKYPTLLFCEGGPQSPVSQFWSYRWNFQIMAANDYIIVAPNRRGLPGFGVEWNEAVSGDYGGQCMKDYLTAIDEMCKEPFVDSKPAGMCGCQLRRLLRLLAGRAPRRTLQGIHRTRWHLQHGNAVSGDRGEVVCQLGHGWRLLGKGQRHGATHLCQLTPQVRGQVGHAHPLHPWRKGLPHTGQPGHGRLRRSQDARRAGGAAHLPGREPLGAETAKRHPVATYLLRMAG